MASYTPNYNLKKPADSDSYDIADANGNMDIIDGALNTLNNQMPVEVSYNSTTNSRGNLSIGNPNRYVTIIGAITDNVSTYVAIGKNSNGYNMLCFRNVDTDEPLIETAVSGKFYYLP